jgi:hypothetical protein
VNALRTLQHGPEFWVHTLRTTKTINRITTIVPTKP